MNKTTIKIFCIFVMIMYCLAPISAIDLNQDSNTTLETATDNENESIDETVNDEKTEMKTVRSSPSNDAPAMEEEAEEGLEVENETVNETEDNTENTTDDENESSIGERTTPDFNVKAYNETGQAKIEISANENISDIVKIKLNSSQEYSLKLENGLGTLTINDLPAGEYEATVSYDGDAYYKAAIETTQFIIKAKPGFSVFADSLGGRNIGIITIYPDKIDDDVKVIVEGDNGYYSECTIKLNKRQRTHQIRVLELEPGTYNVTVIFDGNKYIGPGSVNATFIIPEGAADYHPEPHDQLNP